MKSIQSHPSIADKNVSPPEQRNLRQLSARQYATAPAPEAKNNVQSSSVPVRRLNVRAKTLGTNTSSATNSGQLQVGSEAAASSSRPAQPRRSIGQKKTPEGSNTNKGILKIWLGTWNLQASPIHDDDKIDNWLQARGKPEIVCVGFQEIIELSAQSVFTCADGAPQAKVTALLRPLEAALERVWGNSKNPEYRLITSVSMVGQLLVVYANASIAQRIGEVDNDRVKSGVDGIFGNKGAVCTRFRVAGHGTFCVCNVHLASGVGQTEERKSNLRQLFLEAFQGTSQRGHVRKPKKGFKRAGIFRPQEHDACFLLGDFNFRLIPTGGMESTQNDKNATDLLKRDQFLRKVSADPWVYSRFAECQIKFAPTYKYIVGTTRFDTKRAPAWCDRILFGNGGNVLPLAYNAGLDLIHTSDHRPVMGSYIWRGAPSRTPSTVPGKNEEYDEKVVKHSPFPTGKKPSITRKSAKISNCNDNNQTNGDQLKKAILVSMKTHEEEEKKREAEREDKEAMKRERERARQRERAIQKQKINGSPKTGSPRKKEKQKIIKGAKIILENENVLKDNTPSHSSDTKLKHGIEHNSSQQESSPSTIRFAADVTSSPSASRGWGSGSMKNIKTTDTLASERSSDYTYETQSDDTKKKTKDQQYDFSPNKRNNSNYSSSNKCSEKDTITHSLDESILLEASITNGIDNIDTYYEPVPESEEWRESMCSLPVSVRHEFHHLAAEQKKEANSNKSRSNKSNSSIEHVISNNRSSIERPQSILQGTIIDDPFKLSIFQTIEDEYPLDKYAGYYSSDDFKSFPSHLRPPPGTIDEDISPYNSSLVSTIPLQSPKSLQLSPQSAESGHADIRHTKSSAKSGGTVDMMIQRTVTREDLTAENESSLIGSITKPVMAINTSGSDHMATPIRGSVIQSAAIKGQIIQGSVISQSQRISPRAGAGTEAKSPRE